jgi:hypothetical protein
MVEDEDEFSLKQPAEKDLSRYRYLLCTKHLRIMLTGRIPNCTAGYPIRPDIGYPASV